VMCADDRQALALTARLRRQAQLAWTGRAALDVSAIEYMDARALGAVADDAFNKAGAVRPAAGAVMLLVQIESPRDSGDALAALAEFGDALDAAGITTDPLVTSPGDERGAQRFFELREAVPAGINALVAAAKAHADPNIEKTAADMIVPFDSLDASMGIYRDALGRRGLDGAIWGHVSDGNLHVNVVPTSMADVISGREAIVEMAGRIIALGGSPLAEHGVGRSATKQRLLRELYGEDGIEQMRAVKRALDPGWKLAPGVLFPARGQ
jgi:D-lactate dehydrogenase (cytochrome)